MRTLLAVLLLSVMVFSGCNGATENANITRAGNSNTTANSNSPFTPPVIIKPGPPAAADFQSCNPYFPLVPGSQAKYFLQFSSPTGADVNVIVDRAEENGKTVFVEKTQIIDKSGGLYKNELAERRYICDNGRIQLISEKNENSTEKGASKMEMELRDVAVLMPDAASLGRKGFTWSYTFRPVFSTKETPRIEGETTTIRFEVMGEEKVKVPAGEFTAVKVKRQVKEAVVMDYFVRGIGLVMREAAEGSRWELREFAGLREMK